MDDPNLLHLHISIVDIYMEQGRETTSLDP